MSVVIRVEHLSKYYRLGVIGGETLREDLNRWWALRRGKPDPLLKIGEENHGNRKDGQIWALKDINFEVSEGEILGIIGGNGAGKSTLLKILSRITAPTSGSAKIKGRVTSLLEVGTGFHPELTGRENIYLNGTILGMSRREVTSKLEEIVDFAGMDKFIDTPVKRYSSGMTVRLAFAVAAHLQPEILIIDEVLAVGDAEFQKRCLGKMGDVAREGRTVMFVSHNMAAIQKLCSRAVWLQEGQIAGSGDPSIMIGNYLESSSRVHLYEAAQHPGFLYYSEASAEEGQGACITSLQLLGPDDRVLEVASTWAALRFRIGFEVTRSFRSFSVVLQVSTPDSVPLILTSTTPDQNYPFAVAPGIHQIDCQFERFPLAQGEFVLGLGLAIPGIEYVWRNDAVCRLHVAASDVFDSGLPPAAKRYMVATPHQWSALRPPMALPGTVSRHG